MKKAKVLVLGLGQVGLPSAIALLESGFRVIGLDIDDKLIRKINLGISPVPEKDFEKLITKYLNTKSFSVSTVPQILREADVIIVCVATPLSSTQKHADLGALKSALHTVGKEMNGFKLIIIESTIPPGTMKNFVIPELEQITHKKSGVDFLTSFCPERISPGDALREFLNNDRLIEADKDPQHLALENES